MKKRMRMSSIINNRLLQHPQLKTTSFQALKLVKKPDMGLKATLVKAKFIKTAIDFQINSIKFPLLQLQRLMKNFLLADASTPCHINQLQTRCPNLQLSVHQLIQILLSTQTRINSASQERQSN